MRWKSKYYPEEILFKTWLDERVNFAVKSAFSATRLNVYAYFQRVRKLRKNLISARGVTMCNIEHVNTELIYINILTTVIL